MLHLIVWTALVAVAEPTVERALPAGAPAPDAPPAPLEPSTVGVATAFTKRPVTLDGFGLSASAHLGLVGSFGPTRFVDELRFAPWSFLELRTSFTPLPSSLMVRVRLGDTDGDFGSLVVDGGVASLQLLPPNAEVEAGVTWARRTGDRVRTVLQLRARDRLSPQDDQDEAIVAAAAHFDVDLSQKLGVSAGLAAATTLDTPVREESVVLAEIDRPGFTWLLDSTSDERATITVPLAVVYGVTESFDVDVFLTPKVYPSLGVVAGAGLRLRVF